MSAESRGLGVSYLLPPPDSPNVTDARASPFLATSWLLSPSSSPSSPPSVPPLSTNYIFSSYYGVPDTEKKNVEDMDEKERREEEEMKKETKKEMEKEMKKEKEKEMKKKEEMKK